MANQHPNQEPEGNRNGHLSSDGAGARPPVDEALDLDTMPVEALASLVQIEVPRVYPHFGLMPDRLVGYRLGEHHLWERLRNVMDNPVQVGYWCDDRGSCSPYAGGGARCLHTRARSSWRGHFSGARRRRSGFRRSGRSQADSGRVGCGVRPTMEGCRRCRGASRGRQRDGHR